VNVASRCESLGQPNRIHVSEATAQILQASGRGHWLSRRLDPVEAKGKGIMQTFWVNVETVSTSKSYRSQVSVDVEAPWSMEV
jgi:class 3 adenylate cyclase